MSSPTSNPRKQALFVLLSAGDLALTWRLLNGTGGQVYEANPLANWFLDRHGLAGLVCFKGAVVVLVLALAGVISRFRPHAASRVLGFGCAVLALVVAYSTALYGMGLPSPERLAELEIREVNEAAERYNRSVRARLALVAELRGELLDERCTLGQAAASLLAAECGRDPIWLRSLRPYHRGGQPNERVAAFLICHVVSFVANSADGQTEAAWRVAGRLEREFESAYGGRSPRTHRKALWAAEGRARSTEGRPTSRGLGYWR